MSEFDEFLTPEGDDEYRSHQERNRIERQEEEKAKRDIAKKKKDSRPQSLVEMLTGTDDAANLATKFNLDPEMTERMLVPLVNLLDKYGVGEGVAQSDAANSAVGVVDFLSDIAPVIRGTAEYFSGKRRELSDEDKMLLDAIQQSQSVEANMSLFIGESEEEDFGFEEEVIDIPPEPPAPPSYNNPYVDINTNPFAEGVDWAEVMGMREEARMKATNTSTVTDMMPASGGGILPGVEDLAAEAGLTTREVLNNDRQRRTNASGQPEQSIGGAHPDLGVDEIEKAMLKERRAVKNTSQAVDTNLPTPESVEDHDPLMSPTYIIPSIDVGDMESLDVLKEKADALEESESALIPATPYEDQVEDFVDNVISENDDELDYEPMDLMGEEEDATNEE